MKKIFNIFVVSLIFSGFIIFSINSVVLADSSSNVDKKLKKMGFPDEVIQTLVPEIKEDIVQNGLKYVTSETVPLSESSEQSSDEMEISGTIPSVDMSYTIAVVSTSNSSDNRERFIVYAQYDWLNKPIITLTDPYGISWDPAVFRPVDNSAFWESKWHESNRDIWYSESDTTIAYAGQLGSGVGWNADIVTGWSYDLKDYIDRQYGYGRIYIEAVTPGSITGSTTLVANYYHTTGAGSIGLNIGPLNVSFNGSANYDSRGTTRNFNY